MKAAHRVGEVRVSREGEARSVSEVSERFFDLHSGNKPLLMQVATKLDQKAQCPLPTHSRRKMVLERSGSLGARAEGHAHS